MKINLAENLLRFGAKNLSEESKKKLAEQDTQNLGTINVVAKNPAGENFAGANKGKSFGPIPIFNKSGAYFGTNKPGGPLELVNLVIKDIIYNAPPDAKYDPATKQTTPGSPTMTFVLNSPGLVDDLRIGVSSDGSSSIVGEPKLGKVLSALYDSKGNSLFRDQSTIKDQADLIKRLKDGTRQTTGDSAKQVNQMISAASAILASAQDTKPGVGTKG